MRNFFISLYHFFSKRRVLLFSILATLTVIFAFFGSKLQLDENILSVIPKNPDNEKISFIFENLDASEKIICKINFADTANGNPDILIEEVETLVDSLQILVEKEHIQELFYKVDESQFLEVLDFIFENIPYFLEKEDYQRLDTLLDAPHIAELLAENKEMLTSPIGMIYRQTLLRDPLRMSTPLLKELNDFGMNSQYTTYEGYIMSSDLKSLFLFLTPTYPSSDTYHNKIVIEQLDNIIASICSQHNVSPENIDNQIHISYFGAAAVAVANAQQIKKDSLLSIIVAVTLITLILALYFRNLRSLLLLILPIAFGALFAFALLFLLKNSISAIAIGTGSIIFGIAIDYSLHFLINYRQQASIVKTIRSVSFPLVVGSLTTIGAFITLIFLRSDLLKDFGLFAAFTLCGTIIFTLIFLPHFFKKDTLSHSITPPTTIWNKIANYSFENNRFFVMLVILLTIFFSFFVKDVRFEDDMHKINYMTDAQRKTLKELSENTTLAQQMTYFANEGADIESALHEYEKNSAILEHLKEEGAIISYRNIGRLLPSRALQEEKIERWNHFWENKREEVRQIFIQEGKKIGFTDDSFLSFYHTLDKTYPIRDVDYFQPLQQAFLKEFLIQKSEKAVVLSLIYSTPEKAPLIREQLQPSAQSYSFDTKTMTESMLHELSFDFNYLLWICGLIVLLFLFISFGRIEITFITFLPMVIAFIWILGLMGIFDIHFNIINIILATFIFGIGDDYSIFMMEGLIYEYSYGKKMLNTYKTAVLLSAVTMFIGIGSLIIARHPAMFSLAQVSIIGMISVVIVAYTTAPFIFKWLIAKKGKYRKSPITLLNLSKTIFSFFVFLIGSIILTLIGFFLLTIGRKSKKNRYRYHQCICWTFQFLRKIIPQISCEVRNKYEETFNKPGIIICNHQSHLDLMYTLMLSPKIICLTNKWVWNSPFYGWILRYASYYPVAEGIENNIDKLADAIQEGYSILVFPEGTRSVDGSINRFHQGAFYLAEQLNVDIIPLLIHGIGDVFPKTEFILQKGKITIDILQRVTIKEVQKQVGSELYSIAKFFRAMYKEEYERLSQEVETPQYFRHIVYKNYIYKGVNVEKHARKQLSVKKNLEALILQLPDEGEYVINDCEYGVFALWAALVKKRLTIIATDPDHEKLDLARNCKSIPQNLQYIDFQSEK